jgi:signal transduction histidine kinase/ligand-binding sensor domain-containing protein
MCPRLHYWTSVLLLLLIAVISSTAQIRNIRFERLTPTQDLPSPNIYCILMDHQGFLWFGTGEGLARYDGVEFATVHAVLDGSLGQGQDLIYHCIQSQNGVLWAASPGGGILRHDPMNDSTSRLTVQTHGLSSNSAFAVCEDAKRTLWVGGNGGLDTLDSDAGRFRHVERPSPGGSIPVDIKVTQLKEFPRGSGVLWIGTWGEGFMCFDRRDGVWTVFREQPANPHGPADGHIRTLFMSPNNTAELWIGTEKGGLYRLHLKTGDWQRLPLTVAGIPIDAAVKDINEGPGGALLVSTLGSGLFLLDPKTGELRHFSANPQDRWSLSHDGVRVSFVDPGGVLWIGTRDGINKVDPVQGLFAVHRAEPTGKNGLTHGMVFGLCEDRREGLWVCTDGGGLNRFDRRTGRWTAYRHDPRRPGSLATDNMASVFEDRSGTIWAGGWGGWLHRWRPLTGTFDKWQIGLEPFDSRTMTINCIYQDRAGTLWLGTTQGLISFDPAGAKMTPVAWDGLPPHRSRTSNVVAILEDRTGVFWIATRNGGIQCVSRAAESSERAGESNADSTTLSFRSASALLEDDEGTLWVGTAGGGLNRYDRAQKRFVCYTKREGLSDNVVYGLLSDRRGRIWISTGKGLTVFEPRTGRWASFDIRDGISADEFNSGSAARCADGTLCFGGVSGLTMFRPDTIYMNTHAPPVVLTILEQDGKPFFAGRGTPYVQTVTLPSAHDILGLGFAALDFRRPDRNRYIYRLEGIDKDWIQADNRNYIAYAQLPPGRYLFRVRGSNDSGIWSETDLSITVVVEPHVWQTWWFRILVGSVLAGGFMAAFLIFHRRKISRLQAEKILREQFTRQQIESQETDRKHLAAELHDGLGQNLLIASNELQQFLQNDGGSREYVDRAAALLRESIQSVREIASGLHPHHLDRLGFCAAVGAMTETVAHASGLTIHFDCERLDGLLPKETEIHVYRIIQEALSNAVRHASATEIMLQVKKDSGQVEIAITDNGRGFNIPAGQRHPPFTSQKKSTNGFGLSSMNERARIIGGSLRITSSQGSGTTVRLTVPHS